MVDLVITPASVVAGANATMERGTAGETITAGKVVYKAAGKYMLTDGDSATVDAKVPLGIALNGASLNQPLAIQKAGDITIGATLTPGVAYYMSDDPGGICPEADVATGDVVVLLGLAESATVLALDIQVSGVTR